MGLVFLAVHRATGRCFALKTIKPTLDPSLKEVERFLREARILEQLRHSKIVAFREMGEVDGRFFFVMDYIRGRDAATLLQQEGPLAIPRAVNLVCQMLDALDYAHGLGFVHRDVKPSNLLVTETAGREEVRVLDFGLARAYQMSGFSGLSLAGQVGGTLPFMAPEQITHFRESQHPVDQYGAAATLYNLLTGAYIHDLPRATHQRILKILEDEPVPLRSRRPEVPQALAAVVHRALAREPAQRYPNVAAFRAALVGGIFPQIPNPL